MPRPSLRAVFAVLAAGAVLFAPGMASGAAQSGDRPDPDEVAVAIIAPTFGTSATAAVRSCAQLPDDEAERCAPSVASLSSTIAVEDEIPVATVAGEPAGDRDVAPGLDAPTRAPPAD